MGPLSLGGQLAPNPEHTQSNVTTQAMIRTMWGARLAFSTFHRRFLHERSLSPPRRRDSGVFVCAIGAAERRVFQPARLKASQQTGGEKKKKKGEKLAHVGQNSCATHSNQHILGEVWSAKTKVLG